MKMNDVSEHETHEIHQTHEKEFFSSHTFRVFRDFGVFRVHIYPVGDGNRRRNTDTRSIFIREASSEAAMNIWYSIAWAFKNLSVSSVSLWFNIIFIVA
jgi:hypothetical protein